MTTNISTSTPEETPKSKESNTTTGIAPLKVITIKRTHFRNDGTFGVIDEENAGGPAPFALTVELPWRGNQRNISCIPEGEYTCKRYKRTNGEITFEITNVPNRSAILFHVANTINDLQGCVGIGERFETLHGLTAVLMSRIGFKEFLDKMEGVEEFKLVIRNMR